MVKQGATLTFYGGVNEIGGNKILVKDGDTKVFFDFGMSFGMKKLFYSPHFFHRRQEKVCKNSEYFHSSTAFTNSTKNLLKSTLYSSHMDT